MNTTERTTKLTLEVQQVIDVLQNEPETLKRYLKVLDEMSRAILLGIFAFDKGCETEILDRLKTLQRLRHDLVTIATPPDLIENSREAMDYLFS